MLTTRRDTKKEERTLFEKQATRVIENAMEEARKGSRTDPLKVVRKLKSLFVESLSTEFEELLARKVNVATKRRLYGSPDKSLQLLTVVESRRKPEGYYISFKLAKELPRTTELKLILSALNIATLNAYNLWNVRQICLEEENGHDDNSDK
jgi:hypothetical protein